MWVLTVKTDLGKLNFSSEVEVGSGMQYVSPRSHATFLILYAFCFFVCFSMYLMDYWH